MDCIPWGCKESDVMERLSLCHLQLITLGPLFAPSTPCPRLYHPPQAADAAILVSQTVTFFFS